LLKENRVEALVTAKLNEEAFSIERVHFVKTDRRHNPRKVNPFRFLPGDLPVLVSAPHSVRHLRQKKIKPSDEFTGSIACLLNNVTGCSSLAVTRLYGGDPNYDDKCIYKEALRDISRRHSLKLILDLHGASREHGFDIDIGTINGQSLLGQTEYATELRKCFAEYGITGVSENRFSVSGQNTVTFFSANVLEIPAIQLEINKRFRVPHQNGRDFCRLVGALSDFLNSFTPGMLTRKCSYA